MRKIILVAIAIIVAMTTMAFLWRVASGKNSSVTYPERTEYRYVAPRWESASPQWFQEPQETNHYEIADRLGITGEWDPPKSEYSIGDVEYFWVTNADTDETNEILCELIEVSDEAYLWADMNKLEPNSEDPSMVMYAFDDIVKRNHAFFGAEWTPGIDDDPRVHIVYTAAVGSSVGGYFSSGDEVSPAIASQSNGKEMFVVSADVPMQSFTIFSILAHEHQHAIQWRQDKNEEEWLNEGFSELASWLTGHGTSGGGAFEYLANPNTQLNTWSDEQRGIHYSASYWFARYLYDKFGEGFIKKLSQEQENGLKGLTSILEQTGSSQKGEDVVWEWGIANLIGDGDLSLADRIFSTPNPMEVQATQKITCEDLPYEGWVSQFGFEYIEIACSEPIVITHQEEGLSSTGIPPQDGDYYWFNRASNSHTYLRYEFDLTQGEEPPVLSYMAYANIEEGYDYAYVMIKPEQGNWEMLQAPGMTDDDPTGNNLGWGYTGDFAWKEERVDLSKFAGQNVVVSFEYVTDAGIAESGLAIDDVTVNGETGETPDASGVLIITGKTPAIVRGAVVSRLAGRFEVEELQWFENRAGVPVQMTTDPVLVLMGMSNSLEKTNYIIHTPSRP